MNEQPNEAEWKTIRIMATSYYKLIELSGLMTFLLGEKIPMSTIADYAIMVYHDQYYMTMKNAVMNPDKIAEFREKVKKFKENFARLSASTTKQK